MTFKLFPKEKGKVQWTILLVLILLATLLTSGFQYINWNPTIAGWVCNVLDVVLLLYFYNKCKNIGGTNFRTIVLLLSFLPFLSSINAYQKYDQSYYDSFLVLIRNSIWLLYFFFHKWKVKESSLLKALLLLSLFIVTVQIFQNFFPNNALFGVYNEKTLDVNQNTVAEVRNGIFRFRMHMNGYFTMPVLLAFWCYLKEKGYDTIMSTFVIVMLISIYLSLTRQVMVACVFALMMSFFLGRKFNFKNFLLILFLVFGLYYAYDVLFAELGKITREQATDDNIRLLSFNYYFDRDTEDVFSLLIGHGEPKNFRFSQEMHFIQEQFFFFASDVGIVGKWFYYGLPVVLICYYFLYMIYWKYKAYTPTYIRLFVIYAFVMSPMIFPMWGPPYYLVWTIVAYIVDLHINKSPLALSSTSLKIHKT